MKKTFIFNDFVEEQYKLKAKALYKKYHRKYIYITIYDIEKILKRIDMYESWGSECDLEDKIKRQNTRNEWYDSWD